VRRRLIVIALALAEWHRTSVLSVVFSTSPQGNSSSFSHSWSTSSERRCEIHLCAVAPDYQHGVFAGTDCAIENVTGQSPMTVQEFVRYHRSAWGRVRRDRSCTSRTRPSPLKGWCSALRA
jgi:hypothetical protein